MTDGNFDMLGPLLGDLGQVVLDQWGKMPTRAYVFVAADRGTAQVGLFVEDGDVVRSLIPDDELFEISMEIWRIDNAKRTKKTRWVYFEYDIQDGKFKTHFVYPEDIVPETYSYDWQRAAVKKRFGDKPVIQPDIPTMDNPPHS